MSRCIKPYLIIINNVYFIYDSDYASFSTLYSYDSDDSFDDSDDSASFLTSYYAADDSDYASFLTYSPDSSSVGRPFDNSTFYRIDSLRLLDQSFYDTHV
jgi:hypothetical protein